MLLTNSQVTTALQAPLKLERLSSLCLLPVYFCELATSLRSGSWKKLCYSGPAAARNGQFLKNGANLMDSQQPDQHIGK